MTVSTIELRASADDLRISRLAVLAIALSVAEAAIPLPLPGVKPGLANIVVLLVLLRWGWRDAAWVALLRVFAGSLLLGQLFAPGFFLSLAGATASLLVLAVVRWLPQRWFGPVSLSVCAAWAHLLAQLAVVRQWLIPHEGVWALLPILALAATLFGVVNGLVTAHLLARWPGVSVTAPDTEQGAAVARSPHRD